MYLVASITLGIVSRIVLKTVVCGIGSNVCAKQYNVKKKKKKKHRLSVQCSISYKAVIKRFISLNYVWLRSAKEIKTNSLILYLKDGGLFLSNVQCRKFSNGIPFLILVSFLDHNLCSC